LPKSLRCANDRAQGPRVSHLFQAQADAAESLREQSINLAEIALIQIDCFTSRSDSSTITTTSGSADALDSFDESSLLPLAVICSR